MLLRNSQLTAILVTLEKAQVPLCWGDLMLQQQRVLCSEGKDCSLFACYCDVRWPRSPLSWVGNNSPGIGAYWMFCSLFCWNPLGTKWALRAEVPVLSSSAEIWSWPWLLSCLPPLLEHQRLPGSSAALQLSFLLRAKRFLQLPNLITGP